MSMRLISVHKHSSWNYKKIRLFVCVWEGLFLNVLDHRLLLILLRIYFIIQQFLINVVYFSKNSLNNLKLIIAGIVDSQFLFKYEFM